METICFEIESNEEVWDLIDKTVGNIILDRFSPHDAIEWWSSSISIQNGFSLDGISVRNMEFDIQTDLTGLKKVMQLNTNYLDIYQFSRPVPDTLIIRDLPEESKEYILQQNGLEHIFEIEFEVLTIQSFNSEFIKAIQEKPIYADRIKNWKHIQQ